MWNNYLEKAKAFAENIDKQINDSVGIVDNSTSPSSREASIVPELNDVWNDDFGDDEDEVMDMQQQEPKENNDALSNPVAVDTTTASEAAVPQEAEEPLQPQPAVVPVDQPVNVNEQQQDEEPVQEVPPDTPSPDHDSLEVATAHSPAEPPSTREDAQVVTEQNVDTHGPMENVQQQQQQPELPVERNEQHFQSPMPEDEVADAAASSDVETQVVDQHQEETQSDGATPEELPVTDEPKVLVVEEEESLGAKEAEEEPYEAVAPEADTTETAEEGTPSAPDPIVDATQSESPKTEPPTQETLQSGNNDDVVRLREEHELAMALLQSQVDDLQSRLAKQDGGGVVSQRVEELQTLLQQREDQLASKSDQLTTMQAMHESEKEELRTKIRETKEEAKKRILRAKERVQDMERRLATATQSSATESGAQEEIIAALRQEGEVLARKQSEMEQAVRSARGETRELTAQLQEETDQKTKALEKIEALEAKLKQTKEELQLAKTGESRADQLDKELATVREESERRAATNLSLEQQVKELKDQGKEISAELQQAKKGAELESARASELIKKEHSEVLADLEQKLRTSEREANVRDDALRHEVAEIRKRWQDAVRRADALSMDVQNSTAPLMRQLESTERQNRARAAAWAELETKLRSDLEEHVIKNEKLIKERNELRTNHNRLERKSTEMEKELVESRAATEEKNTKVQQLEAKLLDMETEGQKLKEEWVEVERLASEGVAKVRSDMMKTVVESEERYRSQIESIEKDLAEERELRIGFERQFEELLGSVGGTASEVTSRSKAGGNTYKVESQEKKLKAATGQAEILASTLSGIGGGYEDDEESVDDDNDDQPPAAFGGFAAMEQLTQRLKGSTLELEALRKQLAESERTRESLVSELGETRQASEKLPLFEAKVKELTEQNREMELEIMGLQDDIAEVRHLYRTQLDSLLEEKAATLPEATKVPEMNGEALTTPEEKPPTAPNSSEIHS